MLEKVVTLACVLFGLLSAVSIESWLRRHHGNKQVASDVYTTTLEKYSEFWLAQIIPIPLTVLVVGLLYAFGIGATLASVISYFAGAVICFGSVFLGSRSFATATISASSIISDGDIKGGMRSAYRGGAVMGITAVTTSLAIMSALLFIFKQDLFNDVAQGFALGAALTGFGIRFSGAILTSAHKLSETSELNIDYTGAFAAVGSDYAVSFILAVCSAVLLAEIGVDSSGVSSTFTVSAAAKYPLIIAASGIVASIIGTFALRVSTGKHSDFGFTAGSFLAGILVFASSLYFSMEILGSRVYAYCIGLGILAQLLSGEFCKYFSMGADVFRRNLPKTKDEDVDIPMLHGLSVGLISSFVPGLFTTIAIVLSYNISRQYGVALAATGVGAISIVNTAVREYATTLSASCSFAEMHDDNSEDNQGYYGIIRRTSAKAKAAGRSYSSVSAALTLTALLMSITFMTGSESVDLVDPAVFGGMIFGTVLILVFMGLLIRAILLSTNSMLDSAGESAEEYRNIMSVRGLVIIETIAIASPVFVGLAMGPNCVIGFMSAIIISGMALIFAFNNTGRYYDRIATDALSSVIKMMTAVSIACTAAFIQFGGMFF